ncbi:BON domain-containing protein [Chitinimonas lacunae]|uniref:BON domain-containing protein n=1 Tax=Chitinimonas lacunae TaxID=1963018 RepID=A0ABV8MNF5_9NEIS
MKQLLLALSLALGASMGLGACAVTSGQSTVGQYVDDATITTRVKARFADDPQVNAMRIKVETLNGVVELSGFAVSDEEKERAAQIARQVPEVNQVRNAILVRPPNN